MKNFLFLFLAASICFSAQGQDRTIIGSYWTGLSYGHSSFDNGDSNALSLNANLALHSNVSIGLGLGFSDLNYDFGADGDGVSGLIGVAFHNKFNSGNEVTFDPYIAISTGFSSLDVDIFSWTTIPITLAVGSEIMFSDFFALTPSIGVTGYIDDDNLDLDTLFRYGLAGTFFINDHFSLGLSIGGNSDSTFNFGVHSRIHF